MSPTVEELRAQGFVIQLGGGVDYHRVKLAHPCLHYTPAKCFVTDTAEDAYQRSAASRYDDDEEPEEEEETEEPSEAKQSGSLLDVLLTEGARYDALAIPELPFLAQLKTKTDVVHYRDWRNYRVISADSYSKEATKQCKASALDIGLTPILEHKLLKAMRRVESVRVRLELAGVSFEDGTCQVPIFWVELATDGTPVQCAARLDQLIHKSSPDDLVIRDLKETNSLRHKPWANKVYELRYHLQAAVYKRAVRAVTGINPDFEWVLVRTGSIAVARRKPHDEWIRMGNTEWSFAVDQWAACVKSGMWPGWEMRGVEECVPESYHLTRHVEFIDTHDIKEADDGDATAA